MNYLWEVFLKAEKQGIDEKNFRFVMAKEYSAYMEVSEPFLNQQDVVEGMVIEINPYFRFYDIFKNLYHPEMCEYISLRESITNLIFHQLAKNDVLFGMTREEYYKKLLYQDLVSGAYGDTAKEIFEMLDREEKEIILSGLLRQYRAGSSLDIFKDMIEALIPNSIIYHSNINFYEIFVYVDGKKNKKTELKIDFFVQMFIDLPYQVNIYYEYHFGIIGIRETMQIDEIALC